MAFRLKFGFVMSLTLGRVPLVALFLLVTLLTDTKNHPVWFAVAFGSVVLAAVTDIFDGFFARLFKMETKLGAYADPLTDKIFYLTTLPALVYVAALRGQFAHSAFLVAFGVLFLVRDQWISFLRSIGAIHQMDAKANWSGKWRTIVGFTTICCVYWYIQAPSPSWIQLRPGLIYTLEAASLVINLISIWVYTAYYGPCLAKEMAVPFPGEK